MLKIGTSKMGSVVDCPRCHKTVVVPPLSSPQAEQLYQVLKNTKPQETPAPPLAEDSEDAVSEPALDKLGSNIDDADLDRWIDELWIPRPKNQQDDVPAPLPLPVPDTDSAVEKTAYFALQKRYKLIVTLLYVSSAIVFAAGLIFGIFIRGLYVPSHYSRYQASEAADTHGVTGTLYYLNESGERRADVDAVIICLPKDRLPNPLLSCQGLRPDDDVNNDTVQRIREMEGMYERSDAHGSFTLPYQEGVWYFVILISANQKRTGSEMKPSVVQKLRRYFRDPELFGEHCLNVDEYEWSKHSLRHTFESEE